MRKKCAVPVVIGVFALTALLCWLPASAQSATPKLPNPQFDKADPQNADQPAGWKMTKGTGRWLEGQFVELDAKDEFSAEWASDQVELEPGRMYRFGVRSRRFGAGGLTSFGTDFAIHDFENNTSEWTWHGQSFRVPETTTRSALYFRPWHAKGKLQMDAVRMNKVVSVHRRVGQMTLGRGESIQNGHYSFFAEMGGFDGPNHRTLESTDAFFKTFLWCFYKPCQVTYRFELPSCRFTSGEVSCLIRNHAHGRCVLEVSADQKKWQTIGSLDRKGEIKGPLPEALLPAETVFLRVRSEGEGDISFMVNCLTFDANFDGSATNGTGQTMLVDLPKEADFSLLDGTYFTQEDTFAPVQIWKENNPNRPLATFDQIKPGENRRDFQLRSADQKTINAKMTVSIPDYYRTDYGQTLPVGAGPAAGSTTVWWARADHKIPRSRAVPKTTGTAAQMAACRDDREAIQVVVRGEKDLSNLSARMSDLRGPDGATIPAGNVKVLRAYYHLVSYPTDYLGIRDFWPDALPALSKPIDLKAGENQPLWILVHVPKNAKAGDYQGQLKIMADGFDASVPIELKVWDFTLPEKNHLATAYGFSAGNVFRYHNAKTEADKRKLVDLYFQSFAEHRLSPYCPTPLDPIRVKFLPKADPPRAEVDFTAFDRTMEQAIEKYHFTHFRLPIQGMGGGTFHSRHPGKIHGFSDDTPEYKAMFSSYVKQIESHLKEKGWLDMAYVYWFDEPDPKDYAFVSKGMQKLKKNAPGIPTMLTEQPEGELKGVDIWCPVTESYQNDTAQKLIRQGAKFWWYVCTGPKAPYCTLFIDHPAVELRTWHWQAWKRNIVGSLVWQSTYWTSSAAYPDKAQNPYEDPMGYVSGYSTPKGTKRHWGNGDGRFFYPPLAAAEPGLTDGVVMEGPASSIRLEMLREGVEDWEYLYMLRELVEAKRASLSAEEVKEYEALLQVPESITTDLTHFETLPEPIYQRRAKIAEAIETLQKQK